ncbi:MULTISPECIES: ABC transporter ATP-binding protein [unclassified Streptomyces]|uniref:ABC transporter ATP-binding protein n=1 Tax=unclassified Streptomyces TaxID=2593676 RepID=UPI002ED48EB6|nr:ABC transporter ATP-binding protein/permease [Streptomyces sp. NBC_00891]WSY08606.1 ABC transporter ATP-binding protein/permease [Streptomyces sp. NBC_00890]WSZ10229.1 ABC transporter ATP-binding protein/permease [Streptomyces sp. NBC_00869]WSZ22268.1 ABC transporter ATP-binding protein/permease [Streptomyces sp. NBC_00870]
MTDCPHPGTGTGTVRQPPSGWARRLLGYCLRHRTDLLMAFGAAVTAAVATAALPLVLRHVVDGVAAGTTASLVPWTGLLAALGALRFGASFTRRYRSGRLSLGVQYDLRNDAFAALLRLGGAQQDDLRTGQVVSRSISDITLIQTLLQFLPNLTGNALMFLFSLVVMAFLSPLLTVVALVVGPLLWLIALRSRRDLFPANWHAQQEAAEVASTVEATVTGVRVVKGFGQEQRELTGLERRARHLFASRLRVVRFTSRYNPALQAVPALGQVAVLALGGWMALHGRISLGTFLAFTTYLGSFVTPVRQVATLLTVWQQARAGAERVLEVVDEAPVITDAPHARALPDEPPALSWDDVTFGYGDGAPLLDGFTLDVRPGETLALIGPAGSGKSTAAALLPRFYDVPSGAVRVGGTDVRDLALASLRSRIGYVFEESLLLSDTVRANIAYGMPDATDEQVRAAARIARADEFIERLPQGYDTLVGEQGLTLSGGQRQRMALARALIGDPAVLVLDDATSAIDARVEAEIHHRLRADDRRRTTLIIAHRRSTLELADRVAILDGGRVTDTVTPDELRGRSALFRALLATEDHPLDATVAPDPGCPTPHLWLRPEEDEDEQLEGTAVRAARALAEAAATSGPGRAGLGGGVLGSAPPSPELLAGLARLPLPAADPDVPTEQAVAADARFGLGVLLRPFRLPLLLGLLLVALDAGAQITVPVLVRYGVDRGVAHHAGHVLLAAAAAAAVVVAANWLIGVAQVRTTGRTGERLLYTLRVKTFAQLQRLGLDYYERELGGRIMTRMTTDVDALSNFLQTGLITAVVSLLTVSGVLVALLVIDAELALVLLAALPLLIAATAVFRHYSVPAYREARERISAVNACLQENVTAIRVTQAFRREQRNAADFAVLARSFRDSRLRAQRYMGTFFPFVEFLGTLCSAAVLTVGAAQVRSGGLSAGTLIAFLLYVELFFSPIQQLSQVFDGYQQAVVGLGRLRALMNTPAGTPPAASPRPVPALRGEVEFDEVSFGYAGGGGHQVLHGVTLRIARGETVALVGATGAGKSTVVKLLARFYDPSAGAVRVDGHDLRDLDLTAFRRRLGVVPQEAHLFSGTVRDAVAYGRPDATDAEVERAARAVGAHEMVAGLRLGYLTPVGERGRNLSAGQRQLLALARAELVDPDVLLLDEATASLDLATERRVAAATEVLARRRTTVVVAHRLTTAARADRVVVLDAGTVVETGTHTELLAARGPYRRLWDAFRETGPGAAVDHLNVSELVKENAR